MDDDRLTQADEAELDALFATMRARAPEVPPGLMARIADDGLSLQADRARQPARVPARTGRLRQFFAQLGGWPAMAGLVSATVAGLWIGISPPTLIGSSVALLGGATAEAGDDLYLVDAVSAYDILALGG